MSEFLASLLDRLLGPRHEAASSAFNPTNHLRGMRGMRGECVTVTDLVRGVQQACTEGNTTHIALKGGTEGMSDAELLVSAQMHAFISNITRTWSALPASHSGGENEHTDTSGVTTRDSILAAAIPLCNLYTLATLHRFGQRYDPAGREALGEWLRGKDAYDPTLEKGTKLITERMLQDGVFTLGLRAGVNSDELRAVLGQDSGAETVALLFG